MGMKILVEMLEDQVEEISQETAKCRRCKMQEKRKDRVKENWRIGPRPVPK